MRVRAQVCEEGVRLFAGKDTSLGLHQNLRDYLQRGGDRAEPQKQREQSSALPATPDLNATTLVLPGLRSDQEDEPESQVSKVSWKTSCMLKGARCPKRRRK